MKKPRHVVGMFAMRRVIGAGAHSVPEIVGEMPRDSSEIPILFFFAI